jgi:hypothetical protein
MSFDSPKRKLAIFLLCVGEMSCATPLPPSGDLRFDRQVCDNAYPPQVGNYAYHAKCVNAAVEGDAIPRARYPDLVRLQEQFRLKYSLQADNRVLTAQAAARKMAEIDATVAKIEHDRSSGHADAADKLLRRIEAMLRQ